MCPNVKVGGKNVQKKSNFFLFIEAFACFNDRTVRLAFIAQSILTVYSICRLQD